MDEFRIEKDHIGEVKIPKNSLLGKSAFRAIEAFCVSGLKIPNELIHAYGEVKKACAITNYKLGHISSELMNLICNSCDKMTRGDFDQEFGQIDAFQGGAGTSTNLAINEVIANDVLVQMGKEPGNYQFCDPLENINMHQSTNDTYPTALRLALYRAMKEWESAVVKLQEAFQEKEAQFSHVLKLGRTELMDAVPMTLGRTFSAWAEALTRDRWRINRSLERLRVINLGGTAIGTGLGAPRAFIFSVTEELKSITGLPLARSENLVDTTQNQDVMLEVMSVAKIHAMTLFKISGDLRLLNMGPNAGMNEIALPAVQTGSSIMPGKINPVIPEMLAQIAMQVSGLEQAVSSAVGNGQLELNAFLPLIAYNSLMTFNMLNKADRLAVEFCVKEITANEARCAENAYRSAAMATILVTRIGYRRALEVGAYMKSHDVDLFMAASEVAGLGQEEIRNMLASQALNSLGDKNHENK